MKIQTFIGYFGTGVFIALVASIPLFIHDSFYLHLGNIVFLIMASALGFHLIFNSGQLTFGHSGFLAIGAYTSALLAIRLHFPFFLGFVFGGLVSFFVAAILGIIFSRITGIFFILLTFAAGEVIRLFLINVPSLTYGTDGIVGIPPPNSSNSWVKNYFKRSFILVELYLCWLSYYMPYLFV